MFKKSLVLSGVLSSVLLLSGPLNAADVVAKKVTEDASVKVDSSPKTFCADLGAVIERSDEFKAEIKKFEAEYKKMDEEVQEMVKKAQELQSKLEKGGDDMTEAAKKKIQSALIEAQIEIRGKTEAGQQFVSQAPQKIQIDFLTEVREEVTGLVKKNGWDMVFLAPKDFPMCMIVANPSKDLDVTDNRIQKEISL